MRGPVGRAHVAALVAIPIATAFLSACGRDPGSPDGAPTPPPFHAADVRPVVIESGGSELPQVLDSLRVLSDLRGELVARCLDDAGMPQALQAIAWSEPSDPRYLSGPLRIVPIDLGPSTPDEARTYGLVGSTLPIDPDRAGYVVSRDVAFDRASKRCTATVEKAVPALGPLQVESAELQDAVRDQFVQLLLAPLQQLVLDRYRCVQKAGFPALDPRAAAEAEDWESVLSSVGLEPGRTTRASDDSSSVGPGEVRAFPPATVPTYTPTAGEVELALTFVECGSQLKVTEQLESLSKDARIRLAEQYAGQASKLSEDLQRTAAQVSRYREQVNAS